MRRQKVESSNIAEIGYDLPTLTLQVKFHNGSLYNYWPIGKYTYDRFMSSKSKGIFFNQNIKNAKGINYLRMDL